MTGINRALKRASELVATEGYASHQKKPCIFLSHISVNKEIAGMIGDYISTNGDIDIYFDGNDENLQSAIKKSDLHEITRFIEKGLSYSTHILCLVNQETASSWWLPYEIGFARKSGKKISSLILKGNSHIPNYLKIGRILRGVKSLNKYMKDLEKEARDRHGYPIMNQSLVPNYEAKHPLDKCLNWGR
jgi:hypothetical protein